MPGKAFNDFMADSEPNLTVLTADGGRIRAHAEVSRLGTKQAITVMTTPYDACK